MRKNNQAKLTESEKEQLKNVFDNISTSIDHNNKMSDKIDKILMS